MATDGVTNASARPGLVSFPLRAQREKLDRLREIAKGEHRSTVQKLRAMIDAEIARDDEKRAA